jgi:hypothetical protein
MSGDTLHHVIRWNVDMPLAPLDLFVAVKAEVLALGRRLDALRVNAASGGFGLSS